MKCGDRRAPARQRADRFMRSAIDQAALDFELSPTEVVAMLTAFTARYAAALLKMLDATADEDAASVLQTGKEQE